MSDDKPAPATPAARPLNEGYQPVNKGHQPIAARPTSSEQAGHQPTTSQASPGPATPPSQGSSGKK